MDRLKTFLKYVLWLVGFIILSEFLINVGLNSTYRTIGRKDNLSQVTIYQAEATSVNGRMKGVIRNNSENDLNGKYVKIDFYSPREVFLGSKYIEINNLEKDGVKTFEVYFKLQNVNYYSISITDYKNSNEEIELIPKDLTKPEIIVATIFTFLIFW